MTLILLSDSAGLLTWGALSGERMVLCLQLLLSLASAVILGSESRRTRDHISLSQVRVSPNLEGKAPYLYPSRTEWLRYTPRHWVLFSSPTTTRRVTVEVLDRLPHRIMEG
jgi:hypothetical protein